MSCDSMQCFFRKFAKGGQNGNFWFYGGGKVNLVCSDLRTQAFGGGLGSSPQKILNFRCSEIASGAI